MNAEIDISHVSLPTRRLLLRPWRDEDLQDLYSYASVYGVGQMAGWSPHRSVEESAQILRMFMQGKNTWAIEYQGRAVGSLGIERYDECDFPAFRDLLCREIGYVLAKEYWGQGLMTEAVMEANRYLFEVVGLDLVVCSYFSRNPRSGRVQEKCGFKPYAKNEIRTQIGTLEVNEVNILTKTDWLTAKEKVL